MNKTSKLALAIAGALTVPAAYAAETLEEISVTVSPLDKPADAVAAPVSVLSGNALREAASATLGQTLENQPGVANASFGSGVGLPVIRGQSANRVKVLSDNLDVSDASNTSSDHAIGIEPLLADRIEILRGPATLRYGSGAIGGVVNVIDSRIPTEVPEELEGALEMRHNSGNSQDAGVLRLSGGAGQFAWYLDGVYRENDDTEIPGLAIIHHEEEHDHEEEHEHEEEEFNTDGYVANTDARADSESFGVSWITDSGYIGLSVNHLDNNYGIPLGAHEHSHDEEHEDEELADEEHEDHEETPEAVRIDLVQTRYDLKGEHRFESSYWDKLLVRLGYNDYEHTELEAHEDHFHEGTRFTNKAWEGRVELTHDNGGQWRGAYGLQLSDKDFEAIGEEAFVQPSRTRSAGFFVMKEREWDGWHLDLGGRLEQVSIDPETGAKEDYSLVSASAALQYFLSEHQHVSLGLTHAERAPVAEELFADGAHVAEARYLIGNSDLDKENSMNLELGYHHHNQDASGWHAARVEVNLFYNRVGDYIYAQNTGLEDAESEYPIYAYFNRDAVFYGAEASVKIPLANAFYLTLFGDTVHAQFDDSVAGESRDVPLMPPVRVGLAVGGDHGPWSWEWRTTQAADQDRAGAYEEPTDGYTRMDLTANYNLKLGDTDMVLFASGRNLLDEEIRNSTSLLRDYAPEMGRSIEAGVRFIF
ncbi:TonB-dependent receptor [Microbulbifer thermotolerans]|uniref:TonB-dependent receptor n=1 Tax=Microbulbifer thermotolerans TaxID=252514 RepID=A0AB35I0A6_MICTH|nr:TonB-dependent receptor [Microbulbifer thermotolerans]MCX2781055.1 TonB-dependent receptor [Microbulbifer thermotolerans]MCX2783628.1 TonB-dependent receptor [Microbulbifer thermotolerans]MCX2796225.1 TonB-dependent receptor [Microbulbifer thermotolerans]MCX2803229.1 TonB-dependent receptor [Microbulbifer thermotolerans]MCX2806372.1 TonB-dependent receptor [Microbulbifer thermotolerans]